MQPRSRNLVVGKHLTNLHIEDGERFPLAGRRRRRPQEPGVVSALERSVRVPGGLHAGGPLAAGFPIERPERLVLDNRAAHNQAVLVALEDPLGCAGFTRRPLEVIEVLIGGDLVVAQELEQRAVEVVAAALHRDRGHGAAAKPDFRRVSVGLNLELFDRLDRGNEVGDVNARILRVHAIERNDLVNLALPVGADRVAGSRDREAARPVGHAAAASELNARNQDRQLDDVAAVQRQLDDAFVLYHAADNRILCVEGDRRRRNLDRLGDVTNFQNEIIADLTARLDALVSNGAGFEAVEFALDFEVSYHYLRQGIVAGCVRLNSLDGSRTKIGNGDRRTRNDGASGVTNQPLNRLGDLSMEAWG